MEWSVINGRKLLKCQPRCNNSFYPILGPVDSLKIHLMIPKDRAVLWPLSFCMHMTSSYCIVLMSICSPVQWSLYALQTYNYSTSWVDSVWFDEMQKIIDKIRKFHRCSNVFLPYSFHIISLFVNCQLLCHWQDPLRDSQYYQLRLPKFQIGLHTDLYWTIQKPKCNNVKEPLSL